MTLKKNVYIILFSLICLGILPVSLAAEEFLICPQVFPECDKDGNVASSFSEVSDPCFSYYQSQCYAARIQELEKELSQCEDVSTFHEESLLKMKRKMRRMRRKKSS